ncbi:hypothetical protein NL676_025658 [Syzygium grande]|nr:hypothetical protein NL676_025658 [Syzygium grande]
MRPWESPQGTALGMDDSHRLDGKASDVTEKTRKKAKQYWYGKGCEAPGLPVNQLELWPLACRLGIMKPCQQ